MLRMRRVGEMMPSTALQIIVRSGRTGLGRGPGVECRTRLSPLDVIPASDSKERAQTPFCLGGFSAALLERERRKGSRVGLMK